MNTLSFVSSESWKLHNDTMQGPRLKPVCVVGSATVLKLLQLLSMKEGCYVSRPLKHLTLCSQNRWGVTDCVHLSAGHIIKDLGFQAYVPDLFRGESADTPEEGYRVCPQPKLSARSFLDREQRLKHRTTCFPVEYLHLPNILRCCARCHEVWE